MAKLDTSQQEKIVNDFPNVLILGPPSVFNAYERQFAEKFHLLKPWESSIPLNEYLVTHASSVQAVFCSAGHPINADILQVLPELRYIVTSSAGVDHIDLHECKLRGVNVTNAGSIFSEDVADTAVGLLIDVLRRISAANRFVKAGQWHQKGDYPLAHKVLSVSFYYCYIC